MPAAIVSRFKSLPRLNMLRTLTKVLPSRKPLVLLGEGSAVRLCHSMADQGFQRVLIVTDEILRSLGTVDPMVEAFKARGITCAVFDGVKPDPTFAVVDAGLAALRQLRGDAILVVGGGSAIDAGKVISLSAASGKTPLELVGVFKARQPGLPLFVVPSTSGTGSEVSVAAVISDSVTHVKSLVADPGVVPVAAALDPLVTRGMPPSVTAETGIDALTHALEGWMSVFADEQTDQYNRAAVRMILANLETACTEPGNLAARDAMALASHYAGLSLSTTFVGYVHAIAHQLGGRYGIPHGRANAMVLPHVLAFNLPSCADRFARLARDLGLTAPGAPDAAAAQALLNRINDLLASVPVRRGGQQLKPEDFPGIIEDALKEAHGTYPVPRYMNEADVEQILRQIRAVT